MSKYKVIVGEDFPVDDVKKLSPKKIRAFGDVLTRFDDSRFARLLSAFLVFAFLALLLASATIGLLDGSYNETKAVWDYGSHLFCIILGKYFNSETVVK